MWHGNQRKLLILLINILILINNKLLILFIIVHYISKTTHFHAVRRKVIVYQGLSDSSLLNEGWRGKKSEEQFYSSLQ